MRICHSPTLTPRCYALQQQLHYDLTQTINLRGVFMLISLHARPACSLLGAQNYAKIISPFVYAHVTAGSAKV